MYVIEEERRLFEFERGGEQYAIPCLQDLPLKVFKAMQERVSSASDEEREQEAVYAALDIIEGFAPGATDGLSLRQATSLIQAYVAYGGEDVTLGES